MARECISKPILTRSGACLCCIKAEAGTLGAVREIIAVVPAPQPTTAQHMSLRMQRIMSAVDALGAQAIKQGSRSGEAVFQIAGALQKGGLPHGEQVIRPISAATPPTGKGSPG